MSARLVSRGTPRAAASADFESAPEPAVLCRGDGRVVATNAAARRAFGCGATGRLRLCHIVGGAGAAPLSALAGLRLPRKRAAPAAAPCRSRSTSGASWRGLAPASALGSESGRSAETTGPDVPRPQRPCSAGLAHELNNPLTILLAQATVLHEVAPDADVARWAERIAAAAQRAWRVLADLLATARDPGRAAPPRAEADPPAPRALSVLVVNDEEDVAASLADLLAFGGHAVTVELSPAAALERAALRRFDAVFADLRMPGLDGLAQRDALARLAPRLAGRTVIVTEDAFPPRGIAGPDGAG